MAMVIMIGKIDISVASITAMCSVMMAMAYNAGLDMGLALVLCLVIGTTAGLINGILIAKFKELPAMIITLSTMAIFRGIAFILLENQASGGFPIWFEYLSWGTVGDVIPFSLLMFVTLAVVFWLILHKTPFGRQLIIMGNNETVALFSGIKVMRNTIMVFMLNGFMSGVCALFLTSRMASTRPNVAMGYELEAIAMVVLGGISTMGGRGNLIGGILAVFIVGFLRYGLGLFNVASPIVTIIFGMLLIGSVLISNFVLKKR